MEIEFTAAPIIDICSCTPNRALILLMPSPSRICVRTAPNIPQGCVVDCFFMGWALVRTNKSSGSACGNTATPSPSSGVGDGACVVDGDTIIAASCSPSAVIHQLF
uniref:Uncharacterized protein n=1 Tax=Chaetoceros debilis TaxID=122233 RepID=A0A7S3VC94_9STRA